MPRRSILVLDSPDTHWTSLIQEYFQDTSSQVDCFDAAAPAGQALDKTGHDLAFINPKLLNLALTQKLLSVRQTRPDFRIFGLGKAAQANKIPYSALFEEEISLFDFSKKVVEAVPLPEAIQVVVVDDEEAIAAMVCDYLKGRSNPVFQVRYAKNGEEGMRHLTEKQPDVLILDIKMPVKDGREVYREIQAKKWNFPVVVFFDAVSAHEMLEIRKAGNPVVLEKGSRESTMPEMMVLIKKLAFFG
ncbi:MAG: response regulator [Candidatus Omnitrophota bacterium]|nr:response regulator [Candidatus Omnitrophota bacterium]